MFLCVLALAACNRGESNGPPRGEPPSPATITSTTNEERSAVLEAWRRYWDVYIAVGGELNLPDPRLAGVATGRALQALNGGFLALRSKGQVVKGTIELAPKVISIEDGTARVEDCYASHILIYDTVTDRPIGPEPAERTLVTATLVDEGGSWRVSAISHDSDGCAPSS